MTNLLAPLILSDQTGVEVRVNGHLLAGHGVKMKSGSHLADPAGALGDHHELDDHEDKEHHDPDRQRPADDDVTKGLDDLSRIGVQKNEPRGRHVQ